MSNYIHQRDYLTVIKKRFTQIGNPKYNIKGEVCAKFKFTINKGFLKSLQFFVKYVRALKKNKVNFTKL